jgi:hypothetical protein
VGYSVCAFFTVRGDFDLAEDRRFLLGMYLFCSHALFVIVKEKAKRGGRRSLVPQPVEWAPVFVLLFTGGGTRCCAGRLSGDSGAHPPN